MGFPSLQDGTTTQGVIKLQEQHEVMCRLRVQGLKKREIAAALRVSEGTISRVLGSDLAVSYMQELRNHADINAIDITREIHECAAEGAELLHSVITGKEPDASIKERMSAAIEALRMDGYSPVTKQVVDHRHGFIEKVGMENISKRAIVLREQGIIDVLPDSTGKLTVVDQQDDNDDFKL